MKIISHKIQIINKKIIIIMNIYIIKMKFNKFPSEMIIIYIFLLYKIDFIFNFL